MSDIFVAYAHEDRERVRSLAEALAGVGWSVFWDRTIPTGLTGHSFVGKELKEARCVVVAWSHHAIESEWVLEEAGDARQRQVLIPVLLDPVTPPLGFGSLQALDLTDWSGEAESPLRGAFVPRSGTSASPRLGSTSSVFEWCLGCREDWADLDTWCPRWARATR